MVTTVRQSPSKNALNAEAVVFEAPGKLALHSVPMNQPGAQDVLIDVLATGISTGTERLLWAGEMPDFPGMGYPLIPGYETVGRIVDTGVGSSREIGQWVFVGGAQCFPSYRNLFGGAASRLVVPEARIQPIDQSLGRDGLLLALAATAYHALHTQPGEPAVPDLIIGHGVLGRLLARICLALGFAPPVVWETSAARRSGASGYEVIAPAEDASRDYQCVVDVSGDSAVLNKCMAAIALRKAAQPSPQVILAGFYKTPVAFEFAQAFMRELHIQVAAEWQPADLQAVNALVAQGALSLSGLITHTMPSSQAAQAYEIAFRDELCLKMVLEWGDNDVQ